MKNTREIPFCIPNENYAVNLRRTGPEVLKNCSYLTKNNLSEEEKLCLNKLKFAKTETYKDNLYNPQRIHRILKKYFLEVL